MSSIKPKIIINIVKESIKNMLNHVVYFSSTTENTKRFVEKLGLENTRIPLTRKEETPIVEKPYVLIIPTYGGGASLMGRESHPIMPQIKRFLENDTNVKNMKAVIASGNRNFFEDFCIAGDIISKEYNVPYVYRFELLGTPEDVDIVKKGLKNFKV